MYGCNANCSLNSKNYIFEKKKFKRDCMNNHTNLYVYTVKRQGVCFTGDPLSYHYKKQVSGMQSRQGNPPQEPHYPKHQSSLRYLKSC